MHVEIKNLPFRTALAIIDYCVEHRIDLNNATTLVNALNVYPIPDVDWTLDIPEEQITFILLKFS